MLKTIYIYGAGAIGLRLSRILNYGYSDIIFIDANLEKQRNGIEKYKVLSPSSLINQNKENHIIVVAISMPKGGIVIKEFLKSGYEYGVNIFAFDTVFTEYYLPNIFFKEWNKIFVKYLDFPLTQLCNLRCKNCSILSPYVTNPQHETIDELKKSCDSFFSLVDCVENFYVIGGEPLMYPNFFEIIGYIISQYKEKIIKLIVATNGLIQIDSETLKNIRDNCEFQISDYSQENPNFKNRIDDFCDRLDDYNITYTRMTDFQWMDYGFVIHNNCNINNVKNPTQLFRDCGIDCRALWNSKLYYCFPALMVDRVSNYKEIDNNEAFDLKKEGKTTLLSFLLGQVNKGFLNQCRNCNGSYLINDRYIKVAEQI